MMGAQLKATIESMGDLIAFRNDVRRVLQRLRMDETASEQILLALTELGTNLIRHAGGGQMAIWSDRTGGSVRIEARNSQSPPSLHQRTAGLGIGMGSVGWLMDRVWLEEEDGVLRVLCERGPGARPQSVVS